MAQYVKGNYNDAKANFEKAASLNPNSDEAKMNLGLIKMMNKDYNGAREAFVALLTLKVSTRLWVFTTSARVIPDCCQSFRRQQVEQRGSRSNPQQGLQRRSKHSRGCKGS